MAEETILILSQSEEAGLPYAAPETPIARAFKRADVVVVREHCSSGDTPNVIKGALSSATRDTLVEEWRREALDIAAVEEEHEWDEDQIHEAEEDSNVDFVEMDPSSPPSDVVWKDGGKREVVASDANDVAKTDRVRSEDSVLSEQVRFSGLTAEALNAFNLLYAWASDGDRGFKFGIIPAKRHGKWIIELYDSSSDTEIDEEIGDDVVDMANSLIERNKEKK